MVLYLGFTSIFLLISFIVVFTGLNGIILNQLFLGDLLSIFLVFLLAIIIQSLFYRKFKKVYFCSCIYAILSSSLLCMSIYAFYDVSSYQKKLITENLHKIEGYIRSVDSHSFSYDKNNVGRLRARKELALGRNDVTNFFFSVEKEREQRIRISCSKWNVNCMGIVYSAIHVDLANANIQNDNIKANVYFKVVDGQNILYGLDLFDNKTIVLNQEEFDSIHLKLNQKYLYDFYKFFTFFLIHFLCSLFLILKYRKI